MPPPPPPNTPPSTPPASPTPVFINPDLTFQPPSDYYLFLTDYDGKRISIVDLSTNKVIKNIAVDGHPFRIDFTPDNTKAYVCCDIDNDRTEVCVIDLAQDAEVARIRLLYTCNPRSVTFSPDGKTAYIVSYDYSSLGDAVWTYDTSTYQVIDLFSTTGGSLVTLNPGHDRLIVGSGFGYLSVLDIATGATLQTVMASVSGFDRMKVSPDGKYIIAYNNKENMLYRIDLSTFAIVKIPYVDFGENGPADWWATDLSITPDGKLAVLSFQDYDIITTYNIVGDFHRTGHDDIQGFSSGPVAFGLNGDFIYMFENGDVSVYNKTTSAVQEYAFMGTIPVSFSPRSMVVHKKIVSSGGSSPPMAQISPLYQGSSGNKGRAVTSGSPAIAGEGGTLYVCNKDANSVSVINASTGTIESTISVQSDPMAAAVSPDCKYLYVVSRYPGKLTVFDTVTKAVVKSADISSSYVQDVGVSLDGKYVYVADAGPDYVRVFDAATLQEIKDVTDLFPYSFRVAVNPAGGALYTTVTDEIHIAPGIAVIDPVTYKTVRTIRYSGYEAVQFNGNGSRAFVLDPFDNAVAMLDTGSMKMLYRDMIGVGQNPVSSVENANHSLLYVLGEGDQTVSIINTSTAKVVDKLDLSSVTPAGGKAPKIAVGANGTLLYVVYSGANKMLAIDIASARVAFSVAVGANPVDLILAYPRETAQPQPVDVTGPQQPWYSGIHTGLFQNFTVPGQYQTGGKKVRINGSTINISDGSSISGLLKGGLFIIPLLDKDGKQIGEIDASVNADAGSSNGTISGGTMVLGQNGSLAGEGTSLLVEAALNGMPADPGLNVSFVPADEPLPGAILEFLKKNGLSPVGRPAALVHIDRQNLVNGRDIRSATLKFTAPALDGDLKYYVVRQRDDGKCELLKTVQTNSTDGKNVVIEASSPDGFSTFAMVKATGTPVASPAPSGSELGVAFAVVSLMLIGLIAISRVKQDKR